MRKRLYLIFFVLAIFEFSMAQTHTIKIKLVHTTDVHGNYFPYNFSTRSQGSGSLARVAAYIKEERKTFKQNVLLFDNGDILQGQPTSYYYNYIDTNAVHLCAAMMNDIKYDLANLGNHDVETGHKVFTRWAKECHFPITCANAI